MLTRAPPSARQVLISAGVFHHDGTALFHPPNWEMHVSVPEAADFDGDGRPEVLFSSQLGLTMIEHDGTVKFADLLPLDQEEAAYLKPSAVYDLDGDATLEFVKTHLFLLNVYRNDAAIHGSAPNPSPRGPPLRRSSTCSATALRRSSTPTRIRCACPTIPARPCGASPTAASAT
ncbi:FG-GAP repeat domain-containing protein [Nannocystis pusilla]|uniref:FG-GAP repeat domain-containing protein n=1 Tax=Nannocystis pusilla TaxID=889268 RepID=UPI003BF215D2